MLLSGDAVRGKPAKYGMTIKNVIAGSPRNLLNKTT